MINVTSSFITAVAGCTWSSLHGGCLLDNASGATLYPRNASGAWDLHSEGLNISSAIAANLAGGAANSNGTYTTGGATYELVASFGIAGGHVEDAPGQPPPPPPP